MLAINREKRILLDMSPRLASISQILLLVCIGAGCVGNPYRKFYHDSTDGADISKLPAVILPTADPQLVVGRSADEDAQEMLERGYELVGYSSFNGAAQENKDAIAQAKKVHAAVVMVYSEYSHTVSGATPLILPNVQTSQTSLRGLGASNGFFGTANTTTYGESVQYVPYSVSRFEYFATFWIKVKSPIFGAITRDLTLEYRHIASTNRGVWVRATVKGSPAFMSDVLVGDIILTINDHRVQDSTDFHNYLPTIAGKQVDLEIFRNGIHIKKQIQMNQKSY